MCFVDEHKFEPAGVKFGYALSGYYALNAGYCDICRPAGMHRTHFDIDRLVGVCIGAMPGSLFDQFLSMCEN
jgi:hypothetical protein